MIDTAGVIWRTSSYSSGAGGECVEVADLATGAVLVRDTKDRTRRAVRYTPTAWEVFVRAIKAGEFA